MFAVAAAVVLAVIPPVGQCVTLDVTKVQQRYPWNGLVDIDYTIALGQNETLGPDENLEVLFIDKSVTNRALAFLQAPLPMTAGKHRITWDANADGVTNYADKVRIQMKITHYNDIYMVIDVSKGPNATDYPVEYLESAPPGGFNKEEYKGDKIVLRCIHPGSYMAGSPTDEVGRGTGKTYDDETPHGVRLSHPFYIGLFEITQKQYENVVGGNPSKYKGAYRPLENVAYSSFRGGDWPTKSAPGKSSFLGTLLAKCKTKDGDLIEGLDLPTEAQWEYACRAGTTGAFSTNNVVNTAEGHKAALKWLGRCDNANEKMDGYDEHTTVGRYQANQWGLYDMHGNVWEFCRDWSGGVTGDYYIDPKGPTSGGSRVRRGGAWSGQVSSCRSACRSNLSPGTAGEKNGFRISCDAPWAMDRLTAASVEYAGAFSGEFQVDLRKGEVRVPVRMQEVMPFSYSSTNWTGVAGVSGEPFAVVQIVELTEGSDLDDVKTWKPTGATNILYDAHGEGTLRWRPKKGVWKAEFRILTANTRKEKHREEVWLDLRKSRSEGFYIIIDPRVATKTENFTVGCVNCGEYDYVDGQTSAETYANNWNRLFAENPADVWFKEDTVKSRDPGLCLEAAAVRTPLSNSIVDLIGVCQEGSTDRHYARRLVFQLGMKRIAFYGLHLVAEGHVSDVKGEDGRSPSQRLRQLQFAGLIEDARQFDGAVFSGDFNAQQPWEYDIFKDAGYTCANCSERFGVTATLRDIPADNIIVSPGIEIETFKVVTDIKLNTDHFPLVARLRFKEN